MTLDQAKVEELLELVRKRYPQWATFDDPDFAKDEVSYKRETVAKAQQLLSNDTRFVPLESPASVSLSTCPQSVDPAELVAT